MRSKRPLDEAARHEGLLVDVRARREDLEVADVDLGDVRVGERVLEAALGQAALDGRLPALEVRLEAARAGVLALLPAAGGLAEAGADAAPQARLRCASPRRASRACSTYQP